MVWDKAAAAIRKLRGMASGGQNGDQRTPSGNDTIAGRSKNATISPMSSPCELSLEVLFFRTDAGNEPVRDFLRGLSADEKKVIGEDIKTVQVGWPLGMPLVKKLDKDLWEVRIDTPGHFVRVFFTVVDSQMVLLHVIKKKSNATPKGDLDLAKQRRDVARKK